MSFKVDFDNKKLNKTIKDELLKELLDNVHEINCPNCNEEIEVNLKEEIVCPNCHEKIKPDFDNLIETIKELNVDIY